MQYSIPEEILYIYIYYRVKNLPQLRCMALVNIILELSITNFTGNCLAFCNLHG